MQAARGESAAGRPVIVAEGLSKHFGEVCAVDGVDLEVAAGTVLALLGRNGAGKTTTVRMLATLVAPDGGRARIAGFDVVEQADSVRRLIGLSGQYAAVDPFLTGRENLRMIGRLYGLPRPAARRRADELLDRFDLLDAAERRAGTYSGGMHRRLDVAASLVAAPPVLFLDEPTTGLDPHGRIALWQLLGELTASGTTLLLTTQYMEEADRLADAIAVIDRGRVIARGTSDQLKAQVGGDRLELRGCQGDDPRELARALAPLGSGAPMVDRSGGRVVLAVDHAPALLPELAGRLAAAGLRVGDLALRRPTLEDVFIALTGDCSAGAMKAKAEHREPASGKGPTPTSRSAP